MRIGIFGGTFDPPHLGHLILAAECYDQLRLDHLYWSPTPDPPHKRGHPLSPITTRLELVLAAIGADPIFELSRVELDRPGPHYMVETVELLRAHFKNDELFFLMGGDSFHDLPNWFEPVRLVNACNGLGVMRRPGDRIDVDFIEKSIPGITNKVHFIDAPLLEIASNQIRQRIAQGRPFRYYLPTAVYEIIQKRQLYSLPENEA